MKNKEFILELRKRIPVGLSTAQKLLEQTEFNVNEAESTWKVNQLEILADKISVKPEDAKELLEYVKYDLAKALSIYKERNTTDVEKILESSKKEEQVLANFWVYISDYLGDDVKYGGWIDEKGFDQLPELIRDILIVWQWYAYYDYEGISVEQPISKEVIRILEFKLELQEFAWELKKLKRITDRFNRENPFSKDNLEKHIELRSKMVSSNEYKLIDNQVESMENVVMKKTYNYLYENSRTINNQIKKTFSKPEKL